MDYIIIEGKKYQLVPVEGEIDIISEKDRIASDVEYPIFVRTINDNIYRYDEGESYTLVFSNLVNSIGCTGSDGIDDSDTYLAYNKETKLYDRQPVWFWDDDDDAIIRIGFYNAVGNCIQDFGFESRWDNIEAVTIEQLKTLPQLWNLYKKGI